MAAERPEGGASRGALTSICRRRSRPVEPTPSVAFGDISPSRGEIALSGGPAILQRDGETLVGKFEGRDIPAPLII